MPGLALSGVSKRFGATSVLDNVSLEIGSGEFVVILGPSGCGKSTLLRVIAGLESIDAGAISIEGRRVEALRPGDRGVAMVFQGYALYPHMTVRGNIEFGLRNTRVPNLEIEKRVTDVARMLELTPLLERVPSQLSGGQRQRVAIARAMVKEPKVFMFDEPLSNLDASLRGRMRQEIANLHRRIKATMVFVTHDQTEAMTLADRIVVMNQQRIEQIGSPLQIYRRTATLFVAGFIGSLAMNVLPVTHETVSPALARLRDGTRIEGLSPVAGSEVAHVGIRPEALTLCAPEQGDLEGTVEFIEHLGDRSHVLVAASGGEQLTALSGSEPGVSVGQRVGVRLASEQLHLFDVNGKNCSQRADA